MRRNDCNSIPYSTITAMHDDITPIAISKQEGNLENQLVINVPRKALLYKAHLNDQLED